MLAFLYMLSSTPITWSNPSPGSGTATATVNPTFPTPTGGTAPFTYASVLSKPVGSSAALSNANTLSPSFTTDVEGLYTVSMTATDSRGVVAYSTYSYVYDSGSPLSWQDVGTIDFTTITPQANMNSEGVSYTLGTTTLRNSHPSTGSAATIDVDCTSNGLECVATSSFGAQGSTKVIYLPTSLNSISNMYCIDAIIKIPAMTTGTVITCEVGDTEAITSATAGLFAQFVLASASAFNFLAGRRVSTTTTKSTGQTINAGKPTYLYVQLVFTGRLMQVYAQAYSTRPSLAAPRSLTYKGDIGFPSTLPADTITAVHGTQMFFQVTQSLNNTSDTQTIYIEKVKLSRKAPNE